MVIERNGIKVKLTEEELYEAYREQQHLNDMENIKENLAEFVPEKLHVIREDTELIERATTKLREMLDAGVEYGYSVETAIVETVMDSFNRLLEIKDLYKQESIVMSELLRNYPELTISEKKHLLLWSGDDEFMEVLPNGDISEKYMWNYTELYLQSDDKTQYEFYYAMHSENELTEFAKKALKINEKLVNMLLILEKEDDQWHLEAYCELEDGSHLSYPVITEYDLSKFLSLIKNKNVKEEKDRRVRKWQNTK